MFKSIDNAFDLIVSSFRIFWKYPYLILPVFIVWIFYAPSLIYMKYHFPWKEYNLTGQITFAYLYIYLLAFLLTFSCSILMELLQQNEMGKKFSFSKAIGDSFSRNFSHIVVITIIWSLIWFLLIILQVIFSKKRSSNSDEQTLEGIAQTLSGQSSESSLFNSSIDAIKKGVRMISFLIMPAVAWLDLGIEESFSKGIQVLKLRKKEFIAGFGLTIIVEILIFAYPAWMFTMSHKGVEFSDLSWYICILYIGIATSYLIYIEQMFAAELFLWHLEYEKQVKKAIESNEAIPEFNDVKRPVLLDEIPDLKE